nr:unnamed protein product [Callosobruchus chinensis]
MYARADVQCKAVDVKQYTAEFCAVELSNKVVIITVYRSCAGDSEMFLQLFDRLLEDFSSRYKQLIILGDFNINFGGDSALLSDFICTIACYGIFATIKENTRVFNG